MTNRKIEYGADQHEQGPPEADAEFAACLEDAGLPHQIVPVSVGDLIVDGLKRSLKLPRHAENAGKNGVI